MNYGCGKKITKFSPTSSEVASPFGKPQQGNKGTPTFLIFCVIFISRADDAVAVFTDILVLSHVKFQIYNNTSFRDIDCQLQRPESTWESNLRSIIFEEPVV